MISTVKVRGRIWELSPTQFQKKIFSMYSRIGQIIVINFFIGTHGKLFKRWESFTKSTVSSASLWLESCVLPDLSQVQTVIKLTQSGAIYVFEKQNYPLEWPHNP